MLKLFLFTIITIFISNSADCQNLETHDMISKADTLSNSNNSDSQPDDSVFIKVAKEAEFPGGNSAWTRYLMRNLINSSKRNAPVGTYTVVVKFIVSKTGSVKNIEAETNYGYGMEKELMRIIRKGPKWTPAELRGMPVNTYKWQPVTFVIPNP